jgi:hypothetical protein
LGPWVASLRIQGTSEYDLRELDFVLFGASYFLSNVSSQPLERQGHLAMDGQMPLVDSPGKVGGRHLWVNHRVSRSSWKTTPLLGNRKIRTQANEKPWKKARR